ncbi:MAG: autotransporter domain-containing protein [Zoogloeaceae bacterium]|nr:autotransporter domain-containing protein [Zoogloeaceae bacterium]
MVDDGKNVSIASGGFLNAYSGGHITGDLTATDATLNFYLPYNIDDGDPLLTVGDDATINNSTIKLLLDGSFNLSQLTPSESIKLIDANNLSVSGNTHVTVVSGVSFNYNFSILADTPNGDLLAQLTSATSTTPPPPPPPRTDPVTLTWSNGAGNGLWDIDSAANWSGTTSGGDAVSQYIDGDHAVFSDSGAGAVNVAAGGVAPESVTFDNTSGHDYTLSGGLVTGSTLEKTGDGLLTLTNAHTYSGGVTVSDGTLAIGNGGTEGSVTGNIANNAKVSFNRSDNLAYNGQISGTGTLEKTGAGTLTLSGSNTYSGNTLVQAGTLNLTGSLANSAVQVNDGAALALSGLVGPSVSLASGATLNTYTGGAIGGDFYAQGANLSFYLPETFAAGDTLLDVGGNASIGGSTVRVGILGSNSPLKAGDSVTLLNAASLTGIPANSIANGIGLQGASLIYDFTLTTDATRLRATVSGGNGDGNNSGGGDNGGQLASQTKSLSEGFLAGTAFLNQGADFVADRGIAAALEVAPDAARTGLNSFAAIGGGNLRHETGSHVDVDGYTLVAGLAVARAFAAGELTLGAFIEHGEGDYDTYNSFANTTSARGKGNADHTGAGLIGHLKFNPTDKGHLYAEASLRAGRVELDFRTRYQVEGFDVRPAYDSRSGYASAHAGLGYVLNLNERSTIKLYGQVLWSRQGADTVRLSSGEPVKFQAVDSQRTRLGARWNQRVSENGNLYLGAAWEHEYDGKAKASLHGYRLDTPKLKGDTEMLEAGFTLNPTAEKALTLELGIQGYTGRREGMTGSFRVNYRF